ncbi:uncharacterized protein Tco025E_03683 [Trypanosoma conorhini]|uniref:WW domain-containing protein n=1 Tax=Trypanosoma conorhini TaxID=83891 RepID=A0A3R7PJJ9_9TRYP|nr:uncharacterized protein Tco025E_03683 [Trypanosoma conorhini]RNF20925.1 hypothetical protein Tco025E_03683 [Trypanosoma conorhini]
MEYTCVVAGDAIVGVDALVYLLVDAPLPQALRAQQQLAASSLSLSASENVLLPLRRPLQLPHPSLPELNIRVLLQAARAPSDVAGEEATTVVVLVFSMASADSLQRIQTEWAPQLQSLSRPPAVIFVGMTHGQNKAAPTTVQPGEVVRVAKEVHAKAYFEVDEDDNNTVRGAAALAELRHAIARACTGEFNEMGTVTEATIYGQQQCAAPTRSAQSPPSSLLLFSSGAPAPSPSGGWSSSLARAGPCAVWGFRRHPRTNRLFYVNRVTKKSQYRRPPDYDGEEPELTLQERVEVERERQEQLQREGDLRQEHEELVRFNAALEEHQQRVRMLQSGARQLEHAVERLRMQAASLARGREGSRVSREHVAALRVEVSAKERAFLQESLQFHATQQEEMGVAQRALKEAEVDAEGDESHEEGEEAARPSGTPSPRRGGIVEEIRLAQAAMQTTVDNTRVTVAALRGLLEKSIKQRERSAILHAELASTLKLTESLLQRTAAVDAEEQRIRAALVAERASMETEEEALQPLVNAREMLLQRGRDRRSSAEAESLHAMMLTDEFHRLEEQLAAAKQGLKSLQRAISPEEAYELAQLHRSRNIRACVTAFATWACHIRLVARLQQRLNRRLERLSDLQRCRLLLLRNTRERCVEERISLLHEWYRLDAAGNLGGGGGDCCGTVAHMRLVEERMEQLDTSIERLRTYMTSSEHHAGSHQRIIERCRGVLAKLSLCNVDVSPLESGDEVASCWLLLAGRVREVAARLGPGVISLDTANALDGDGADVPGVTGEATGAAYVAHARRLQQELCSSAGRSLLRHFRPEELQEAARRLSRQHALGEEGGNDRSGGATDGTTPRRVTPNATSSGGPPASQGNGELSPLQAAGDASSASAATAWMEHMLRSVLAPAVDSCGLDMGGATLPAEERAAAQRPPASCDALRERLRREYA